MDELGAAALRLRGARAEVHRVAVKMRIDELGKDPRALGDAGETAANATPSREESHLFGPTPARNDLGPCT